MTRKLTPKQKRTIRARYWRWRKPSKRWTQKQLAAAYHVSQCLISKIVNAPKRPRGRPSSTPSKFSSGEIGFIVSGHKK